MSRISTDGEPPSYKMGIDDAVLLMVSVVLQKMINLGDRRHSTVISNDRFQDYAYGTRLNYAEIEHENLEEYMRTPLGQEWAKSNPVYTPKRLRGLAPSPSAGRQISLPGEATREDFETKFDSDTGTVVIRRRYARYAPASPENVWKPLNKSNLFFVECGLLLRSKMKAFSVPLLDIARGLQQTVFDLVNQIAMNLRNSDVAYIVDVENMFHISYGNFETRFMRILPALNKYFRRRYRGEMMWGPDGNTGADDPAAQGQRVTLVLPVYQNKQRAMIRGLEAALGRMNIKFNIVVVPFNIDFFNTLARRSVTPGTRPATPFTPIVPSPKGSIGGGKRRKIELRELFASLRF